LDRIKAFCTVIDCTVFVSVKISFLLLRGFLLFALFTFILFSAFFCFFFCSTSGYRCFELNQMHLNIIHMRMGKTSSSLYKITIMFHLLVMYFSTDTYVITKRRRGSSINDVKLFILFRSPWGCDIVSGRPVVSFKKTTISISNFRWTQKNRYINLNSQTWAYGHLSLMTIIYDPFFNFYIAMLPLNNDHLSTTATIFGFQGWSLYKFQLIKSKHLFKTIWLCKTLSF